jgi:hypothetical protein
MYVIRVTLVITFGGRALRQTTALSLCSPSALLQFDRVVEFVKLMSGRRRDSGVACMAENRQRTSVRVFDFHPCVFDFHLRVVTKSSQGILSYLSRLLTISHIQHPSFFEHHPLRVRVVVIPTNLSVVTLFHLSSSAEIGRTKWVSEKIVNSASLLHHDG